MEGLPRIDAVVLLLAAQLALGTVLYAAVTALLRFDRSGPRPRRRRLVAWAASTRGLARTLPYTLALLACAGLARIFVADLRILNLARFWPHPSAFLVCGALCAASCYVLLHAGSRERHGELVGARVEARLGGRLLFLGVLSLQILVWSGLILDSPFRRASLAASPVAALLLTTSLLVLGFAAFVALVSGLAGKPRPSGPFAVALYLIGVLGLLAARGLAQVP